MKFSRVRQVGVRKTISHNNSINNKDACLGLELAHCSQPQSSSIWASGWLNSSNNQVWDSALLGGGEIWFCGHLIFSRETSLGRPRWHINGGIPRAPSFTKWLVAGFPIHWERHLRVKGVWKGRLQNVHQTFQHESMNACMSIHTRRAPIFTSCRRFAILGSHCFSSFTELCYDYGWLRRVK